MVKEIPVKMIKPEFLDFFNYNICKTYAEKHGKDEATAFFRKVAELGFQELRKQVEFPSSEPYDVLKTVAGFLEDMGYIAKIQLTKVEENEVVIELYGVSVIKSYTRLVQEGASPSHTMTYLMFAALKEISGFRADSTTEQASPDANYYKARWVLEKT